MTPITPADREILVSVCTEAGNDRPILIHPSAVLSLDAALTMVERERDALRDALRDSLKESVDHGREGWSRVSAAERLLSIEQEKTLAAARECGRLATTIRAIRDHDPETCPGITPRDCLEVVQELARAALPGEL